MDKPIPDSRKPASSRSLTSPGTHTVVLYSQGPSEGQRVQSLRRESTSGHVDGPGVK